MAEWNILVPVLGIELRFLGRTACNLFTLQIYSLPELLNTAHSCSQHGSANAWLTSEWLGVVIVVPKTSTLLGRLYSCASWGGVGKRGGGGEFASCALCVIPLTS